MTTKVIDYCQPILNKSFDVGQCVVTHLPWWSTPVLWVIVILLLLTIAEKLQWLLQLLFLPGLQFLWEGLVKLFTLIKSKVG